MATQEEILKILLQVQGSDEVVRLQKEQEKLEADIVKLTAAMQGQNAATVAADPAMQRLANQYHANAQRLDELDRQLGGATNKMAGFGQSALQGSRALQDFTQGGLMGVLNNIEGVSMALGGGPGLAGIMTAVGVAAFIARPYIEDLIESMKIDNVDEFAGSITKLKERIKELEDKKLTLAIDDAELLRLTKEVENLTKAAAFANQLLTKQTKAESASGRAVEDAIVETPGAQEAIDRARQGAIGKAITESKTVKANRDKMAEEQAKLDKENTTIAAPGTGPAARLLAQLNAARIGKELEKLREANRKAIAEIAEKEGKIFDQIELDAIAGKGKVQAAAQKKLTDIVGADSKAGKTIAENSPQKVTENEAASNEADSLFDALDESNKRAKEARLKRQAAAKKAATKQAAAERLMESEWEKDVDGTNDVLEAEEKAAAKGVTVRDKEVDTTAKQFSGGALGEDVANAMKGGMPGAEIEEKTKRALAGANVAKDLWDAVAKAVIEDVTEKLATEGNKAVRLPTSRPRTTKFRPKTVEQRVAAAREANAARRAKAAAALANRKAALAARRRPKRQDIAIRGPNGGKAAEQEGPQRPAQDEGQQFTNLMGTQAQQTGMVLQNQTALVNRIIAVENQQRTNQSLERAFNQRYRTMQMRGR